MSRRPPQQQSAARGGGGRGRGRRKPPRSVTPSASSYYSDDSSARSAYTSDSDEDRATEATSHSDAAGLGAALCQPVKSDGRFLQRAYTHERSSMTASQVVDSLFLHWDGDGKFRVFANKEGVMQHPLEVSLKEGEQPSSGSPSRSERHKAEMHRMEHEELMRRQGRQPGDGQAQQQPTSLFLNMRTAENIAEDWRRHGAEFVPAMKNDETVRFRWDEQRRQNVPYYFVPDAHAPSDDVRDALLRQRHEAAAAAATDRPRVGDGSSLRIDPNTSAAAGAGGGGLGFGAGPIQPPFSISEVMAQQRREEGQRRALQNEHRQLFGGRLADDDDSAAAGPAYGMSKSRHGHGGGGGGDGGGGGGVTDPGAHFVPQYKRQVRLHYDASALGGTSSFSSTQNSSSFY